MQLQDALRDWAAGSGPLYQRLADALRELVHAGDLQPGAALLPERALAKRLAVGRSTVVSAYDQLRRDGVLTSRQGSGTWVAGADRHPAANEPRDSLRAAARLGGAVVIDLATAALPAIPLVGETLAAMPGDEELAVLTGSGYLPAGLPRLRDALADRLTREGLPTVPDQMLVTTGSQQALTLICEHVLHAGDAAVVEDPTNPGILDVLQGLGIRVRGAPSLATGIGEVLRTCDRADPRMLYLMSTLGPEGAVLSDRLRGELVEVLAARSVVVIDDTSQAALCFEKAPPPLGAYAPDAAWFTVGSLSKLYWGGLRVGWVRAPTSLITGLTRLKARTDLGTPVLEQLIALRLVAHEDAVRTDRLTTLHAQLTAASRLVAELLPDFGYRPPAGGLNLWLRLPYGSANEFAEVAARHGVAIVPGDLLSAGGYLNDRIRVVYARPFAVLEEGFQRLAAAWAHFRDVTNRHLAYPPGRVLV